MAKYKVFPKEADDFVKDILSPMQDELLSKLKEYNPVDDTTTQKAYDLYQQTGHWAWVKDDVVSSQMWKNEGIVRSKDGVTMRMSNRAGYITHLVEGFVTVDPKWGELFAVERTSDGQFSQQDPRGEFVDKALVKTLWKFGYDVTSMGKYNGGG